MKPGTVFTHQYLGKCIVMKDANGLKKMVFKREKIEDAYFFTSAYPWTVPMKILTGD